VLGSATHLGRRLCETWPAPSHCIHIRDQHRFTRRDRVHQASSAEFRRSTVAAEENPRSNGARSLGRAVHQHVLVPVAEALIANRANGTNELRVWIEPHDPADARPFVDRPHVRPAAGCRH
jgi:hypothetical protein